jgi:hypothetical protein
MMGLDGKHATVCDCAKMNCLHQYVIEAYGLELDQQVLCPSLPRAFMVYHQYAGVDYLFTVSKAVTLSHDAAKRTIVTLGNNKWKCTACGNRVQYELPPQLTSILMVQEL